MLKVVHDITEAPVSGSGSTIAETGRKLQLLVLEIVSWFATTTWNFDAIKDLPFFSVYQPYKKNIKQN